MSWINIKQSGLPKAHCECWVIDGYETITHETYYFGIGGFLQSRTMSLRDPKMNVVAYWVIDKPMSPKQIARNELVQKLFYVHDRINVRSYMLLEDERAREGINNSYRPVYRKHFEQPYYLSKFFLKKHKTKEQSLIYKF